MAPSNHPLISSLIFIWLASTNIQALYHTDVDAYNLTFPQHSRLPYHLEPWSDEVFGDRTYAYAHCDNDGRNTNSRNCAVVLARFDNERFLSSKSCNVNFSLTEGTGLNLLHIHSAHDDRVVLYYPSGVDVPDENSENTVNINVKLEVVHMNSCELYETKVPTVSPLVRIANYIKLDIFHHDNNTFDVLIPYASCDGARCKYTFNDKAQQIGGPLPVLPIEYKDNIVRVYPLKAPNAYFAFVTDLPLPDNYEDIPETVVASQKLLYVRDGVVTQATNFSIEVYTSMSIGLYCSDKVYVKNSGDLFGFCRQYTVDGVKRVNCMQFDDNNNKRIDVTVDLENSSKVLGLYNAPKGLLVFEASCDQELLCGGFGIRKVTLYNEVGVDYLETDHIPAIYTTAQSDGDEFFITMYGVTRRADRAGTVDILMTKIFVSNGITYFN